MRDVSCICAHMFPLPRNPVARGASRVFIIHIHTTDTKVVEHTFCSVWANEQRPQPVLRSNETTRNEESTIKIKNRFVRARQATRTQARRIFLCTGINPASCIIAHTQFAMAPLSGEPHQSPQVHIAAHAHNQANTRASITSLRWRRGASRHLHPTSVTREPRGALRSPPRFPRDRAPRAHTHAHMHLIACTIVMPNSVSPRGRAAPHARVARPVAPARTTLLTPLATAPAPAAATRGRSVHRQHDRAPNRKATAPFALRQTA